MNDSHATQQPSVVVDFAVLDELRALSGDDDTDLVSEIVTLFLADSPRRLGAIRDAAARGDSKELGRAAHGLKGSAANVGGVRLRAVCERLEYLGKSGTLEGTGALVEEMDGEYQRVRLALEPLARPA